MYAIAEAIEDIENYKEDLEVIYLKSSKLLDMQGDVVDKILDVLTEVNLQLQHVDNSNFDKEEKEYLNKIFKTLKGEEEEDDSFKCNCLKCKIKNIEDKNISEKAKERIERINKIFDDLNKSISEEMKELKDEHPQQFRIKHN